MASLAAAGGAEPGDDVAGEEQLGVEGLVELEGDVPEPQPAGMEEEHQQQGVEEEEEDGEEVDDEEAEDYNKLLYHDAPEHVTVGNLVANLLGVQLDYELPARAVEDILSVVSAVLPPFGAAKVPTTMKQCHRMIGKLPAVVLAVSPGSPTISLPSSSVSGPHERS